MLASCWGQLSQLSKNKTQLWFDMKGTLPILTSRFDPQGGSGPCDSLLPVTPSPPYLEEVYHSLLTWICLRQALLIFCTVYSKHIYYSYLWVELACAVTRPKHWRPSLRSTSQYKFIRHSPPYSFIRLHPGAQGAIVNPSPPWEKMGGGVLKLINTPINDLDLPSSWVLLFFL